MKRSMAQEFFRNQNLGERTWRLNRLSDRVDEVEEAIQALAQSGGDPTAVFDPGDLGVYYENGKA